MMIHNITWINQNSHIPSVVMSDYAAREIVSKEIQKVINEEKERKVEEIRPVEEIEKVLPYEERIEKSHINLKV